MGETRKNDINLEQVADKLAAAEDSSRRQDEAPAGMADAQASPCAKKEKKARKRAPKKKTAKKKAAKKKKTAKKKAKKTRKRTPKKTVKKKARKKGRAKAVPAKRPSAKEPIPEEASPEADPGPVKAVDKVAAPKVAVAADLDMAPEDAAEKRPSESTEHRSPEGAAATSPDEAAAGQPEEPVETKPEEPAAPSPLETEQCPRAQAGAVSAEGPVARETAEEVACLPREPVDGRPAEPAATYPLVTEQCPPAEEATVSPAEPVELSPEEALKLLGCLGDTQEGASAGDSPSDAAEAAAGPGMMAADAAGTPAVENAEDPDPGSGDGTGMLSSIIDASCRVLTFESESVEDGMCVARAAVEQLRLLAAQCGLGVSIGPICRTPEEFTAEWDNTPASMPVTIIANLSRASALLPGVVNERPRIASAYWIVFETLRGEVSTARSAFLSELRSRHRLRAIGFGPRNIAEAARGGAEALRGHVEWGFGRGPVSIAG